MQHLEISNEEYHARPELSRSQIMDYIASPEVFYRRHVDKSLPRKEPTPAMEFGIMIDACLTEERWPTIKLPERVVEIPEDVLSKSGSRAGNAWKDWFNSQPDGVECWREKDVRTYQRDQQEKRDICRAVSKQVTDHEKARWLVRHPEAVYQPSFLFDHMGCPCKSRPDIWIPDVAIVDIKTAADVSAEAFARSAYSFGYDVQGAMARLAINEDVPVVFVCIHNVEPYEVEVYEMSGAFLRVGEERLDAAIEGILSADEKPMGEGFRSPTHGSIVTVDPPRWIQYREEFKV